MKWCDYQMLSTQNPFIAAQSGGCQTGYDSVFASMPGHEGFFGGGLGLGLG
jgi:hypothetical protein